MLENDTVALENLLKLVTGTALKRRKWQDICHDLLRYRDEATVLRLASELLQRYDDFEISERQAFLNYLLREFRVDQPELNAAIEAYREDPSPLNVQAINRASLPSRRNLFEILNMCPGGTERLLAMRVDLSRLTKDEPELRAVDSDLELLFRNWFNRGFLTLQRIDWQTPAFVLEKLIAYEAVHEIKGWDDLRRRVSSGRRCYAFFHPALPNEPIIFVQVALEKGLVASVNDILEKQTPEQSDEPSADTAVFYSISNCQRGLVGIAFGDLLIKQVAEQISSECPQIKTFATLSPVPGLTRWLQDPKTDLDANQRSLIEQLLTAPGNVDQVTNEDANTIVQLCAEYLVNQKRGVAPLDPVARFHLRNGARLERINWGGDSSAKGLKESLGILVNYVYDLSAVTKNHETYVYDSGVVTSSSIKQLAKR
ncbi:MAG: decarboxylase [Pseudomonadales bacterium]|nr:decarboxylase [Pseudomonadales bacterium]